MSVFNFECEVQEATWLVEPIIPLGQLCVNLAQAGVGKSLLVESLAVHVVCGVPFCGFKTAEGDVLLIDQDTPQNVLYKRLIQMAIGLGLPKKHELFLESMNGYNMSNGTLVKAIRSHPSAKLIIIDCLHTVCGQYNPNYTSDMTHWANIKQTCLNEENTILLNHHITQKGTYTIDDLMQGETSHLAMGSSAIIQQADTYYVIGATATEGKAERIYVRPVSKRISIPSKPLILRMLQTESHGEKLEYEGYYEPELENTEQDLMMLFREQPKERTVKETYEDMGHRYGEKAIRQGLASLEQKGMMLMSRHKANLFTYRLP